MLWTVDISDQKARMGSKGIKVFNWTGIFAKPRCRWLDKIDCILSKMQSGRLYSAGVYWWVA
jgi:hypothetical protein